MTGLEEDQEFDFDFLFEFNQSDEGAVAAPGGSARGLRRGRGRGAQGPEVRGPPVLCFGVRGRRCRTLAVQGWGGGAGTRLKSGGLAWGVCLGPPSCP